MRCGARCFQIKLELHNKCVTDYVNARTPADARIQIKKQYGPDIRVIAAIEKRKGNLDYEHPITSLLGFNFST